MIQSRGSSQRKAGVDPDLLTTQFESSIRHTMHFHVEVSPLRGSASFSDVVTILFTPFGVELPDGEKADSSFHLMSTPFSFYIFHLTFCGLLRKRQKKPRFLKGSSDKVPPSRGAMAGRQATPIGTSGQVYPP